MVFPIKTCTQLQKTCSRCILKFEISQKFVKMLHKKFVFDFEYQHKNPRIIIILNKRHSTHYPYTVHTHIQNLRYDNNIIIYSRTTFTVYFHRLYLFTHTFRIYFPRIFDLAFYFKWKFDSM